MKQEMRRETKSVDVTRDIEMSDRRLIYGVMDTKCVVLLLKM